MNEEYKWNRYPEAWQTVKALLDEFALANPDIKALAEKLFKKTGTRLIDFIDHLVVDSEAWANSLEAFGFQREGMFFSHPAAILPGVLLNGNNGKNGIAVKVDSIAQFLMTWGVKIPHDIEGGPFCNFRRCEVSTNNGVTLWIEERGSVNVMAPMAEDKGYVKLYLETLDRWQTRPRALDDKNIAMDITLALARELVKQAGTDLVAFAFFEAERRYWLSRNRAAAVQKIKQDNAGMGWANHDHHTFRSSRELFPRLVRFFQILGFNLREKFYAGEEAGWGAQVVEHPGIGVALFLDVDLSPDELDIDFLSQSLPAHPDMGTVGLWCALHGDSILEAGLHHLAVLSDFDRLTASLKTEDVDMMEPFSTLPYLLQAFTHGQFWPVKEHRLKHLLKEGFISEENAQHFTEKGAIGSHLENIQREDGFKGFSQKEVSKIIKETDPRV